MTATVQALFEPDQIAMRQHVEHLFGGDLGGCHDGKIELAWTDNRPDTSGRYRLKNARLYGTHELDELVAYAAHLNSANNCNVYVGAALRKPDTSPFGRGQDSDAYALTCAYVDLDDPGAAGAAKDIYGLDKPTFIVLTGRAPHVRAQMWWRLEEPILNTEWWPSLLRGIATKMSGDSTVTNPSRVMRLAGSIAWPVKEGRTVELTSIAPLREPGPSAYAIEHLAHVFPAIADSSVSATPSNVTHATNGLGLADKVMDGREQYMRDTITACLVEYIGTTGAAPNAQELYDLAWPQYERKVDLTRAGRGPEEFAEKCSYTVNRFERGEIRGVENLEAAVAAYARKERARAEAGISPKSSPIAAAAIDEPDNDPIQASSLTGKPADREWLVKDWIPKGVVSSLSGDGGMGKTLLAQQLLYAAGVGGKWLGIDIPKSRGLGVFCEDDQDELHRRHSDIKTDLGFAVGNPFDETWIWPRVGHDNLLVTFDKDNKPSSSPFFAAIMKNVMEKRIELLVLDTIADLFGGNEIIRAQVNYFIKATCGAFIKQAKADGFVLTVILLSHPSQAGRNSGSGESGSTAWNNAVRARLYLTRPDDGLPEQRILTRKKSNYSSSGDDVKLDLLWADGVLKIAADTKLNSMAVKSVEAQIKMLVSEAWDSRRPYHAKKGQGMRPLEPAMVAHFGGRVEIGVIIAALNNLKNTGEIAVDRSGDLRGYNVLGDLKSGSTP